MRDEGDMIAGDWEGPSYEYGVTWGPVRLTVRQLVGRVSLALAVIYVLLTTALVLFHGK